MLFSFFKTRKNRQFDFQPRYYNPEQEERNARIKASRGENEDGEGRKNISFRRPTQLRAANQRSNRNVLVLVVLLGGMFYLLIQGYLDFTTTLLLMGGYLGWRLGVFQRLFGRKSDQNEA